MNISKGYKLSQIRKDNVQNTKFLDQGDFVFQYNNESEWYFVLDNSGNKISKTRFKDIEVCEFGNSTIWAYLSDKETKTKKTKDK